ncbi:MAG: M48 family metalloprotease [Thermoplasmata archaeon]
MIYILTAVSVLYWTIRTYGQLWWSVAWGFLASWIVARTYLESVITVPYLFRPARPPPQQLRGTLTALAAREGIKAPGVRLITSRKSVPKAIVSSSGMGNTKRIFVNDHFLAHYTSDEIEAVLSHELGHQVHKDTAFRILLTLGISAAGLFLANSFVQAASGLFGIPDLSNISTLPLFVIFFLIFWTLADVLRNSAARRQERRADSYASSATGNPRALSTALLKMNNEWLGDARAHRLVEIFFYTHPSTLGRVKGLLGYDPSVLSSA